MTLVPSELQVVQTGFQPRVVQNRTGRDHLTSVDRPSVRRFPMSPEILQRRQRGALPGRSSRGRSLNRAGSQSYLKGRVELDAELFADVEVLLLGAVQHSQSDGALPV